MLGAPAATIRRARVLRREMSLPEVILWRVLRTRPTGLKFRRQHPVGRYVADFFCVEAALVIEVDGAAHDRGDAPERDSRRDAFLETLGIATLRIAAGDVLGDLDGVVRGVVDAALARRPLHQPAAGPPPRPGEDFGDLPIRTVVAIFALISTSSAAAAAMAAVLIDTMTRG